MTVGEHIYKSDYILKHVTLLLSKKGAELDPPTYSVYLSGACMATTTAMVQFRQVDSQSWLAGVASAIVLWPP